MQSPRLVLSVLSVNLRLRNIKLCSKEALGSEYRARCITQIT